MSILDVHAADQALCLPLLDLEGQTTLFTGDDLPVRVVFDADAPPIGLTIAFHSETAPAFNVWDTVQRQLLDVWRQDHGFAHHTTGSARQRLGTSGTPIGEVDDRALVGHSVLRELLFRTILEQWRSLVAERSRAERVAVREANPRASEAWNAFEELSRWLELSHGETAELLGLGKKTAYGWRRERHPPQPRLARRLYQAHAFVRQLVLAVGEAEAKRMLSRGGEDSALALVADNRVAEAESHFAHLIYKRAHDVEAAVGTSRSGDGDVGVAAEPNRDRLPGGRRRVELRRGR